MTDKPFVLAQANIKPGQNAPMLNAYGYDEQSFKMALAILSDAVGEVAELNQRMNAALTVTDSFTGTTAATAPAPQGVAQQDPWPPATPAAAPPAAPAPAFQQASMVAPPSCQHGPRVAKSGQSAKGPWKAWMCTMPKGQSCQPQWLNRGTAEWDNHPA